MAVVYMSDSPTGHHHVVRCTHQELEVLEQALADYCVNCGDKPLPALDAARRMYKEIEKFLCHAEG